MKLREYVDILVRYGLDHDCMELTVCDSYDGEPSTPEIVDGMIVLAEVY